MTYSVDYTDKAIEGKLRLRVWGGHRHTLLSSFA